MQLLVTCQGKRDPCGFPGRACLLACACWSLGKFLTVAAHVTTHVELMSTSPPLMIHRHCAERAGDAAPPLAARECDLPGREPPDWSHLLIYLMLWSKGKTCNLCTLPGIWIHGICATGGTAAGVAQMMKPLKLCQSPRPWWNSYTFVGS